MTFCASIFVRQYADIIPIDQTAYGVGPKSESRWCYARRERLSQSLPYDLRQIPLILQYLSNNKRLREVSFRFIESTPPQLDIPRRPSQLKQPLALLTPIYPPASLRQDDESKKDCVKKGDGYTCKIFFRPGTDFICRESLDKKGVAGFWFHLTMKTARLELAQMLFLATTPTMAFKHTFFLRTTVKTLLLYTQAWPPKSFPGSPTDSERPSDPQARYMPLAEPCYNVQRVYIAREGFV